jgi:hypothetical protein
MGIKFIRLMVSITLYWSLISFILMNNNIKEWNMWWRATLVILSVIALNVIFNSNNKNNE